MKPNSSHTSFGVLLGLLVGFAALCAYLLKPDLAGFFYDDGMYLMAAKALANGHGYRMMEISGQPWLYKYPPLYPLALAGLWKLNPHFPDTISLLKPLNILLSTLSLGLLFYYYRQIQRFSDWVSLGLIAMIASHWRLIEVTIELMSEPLYLLLTLLSLIVAHRLTANASQPANRWTFPALIVLSAAAFYTRSMGLILIAAIGLLFLLSRQWKQAGVYLGSTGLLILPWVLWSRTRPDTTVQIGDFLLRTFQETYFQSMRMDLTYETTLPAMVSKGFSELLGNLSIQFFPLLERGLLGKPALGWEMLIMGLSFGLALYLGYAAYQAIREKALSAAGLYTGLYLMALPFWSFYKAYPRFLIMIVPFLFGFLIHHLNQSKLSPGWRTGLISLIVIGSIGSNGLQLIPYIQNGQTNPLIVNSSHDLWASYKEVLTYLKTETPSTALLYSDNGDEAFFYALNTQRPTLDAFVFLPMTTLEAACPTAEIMCLSRLYTENAKAQYEALKQNHVDYLIENRYQITKNTYNSFQLTQRLILTSPIMRALHPQAFKPVAQSSDGWITVYRFLPERAGKPKGS